MNNIDIKIAINNILDDILDIIVELEYISANNNRTISALTSIHEQVLEQIEKIEKID